MITTLTRQDFQSIVDAVKNRILDKMASRSDMQRFAVQLRTSILSDLNTLHQENQDVIKRGISQREDLQRRTMNIENRMQGIEQDVKYLASTMQKLFENQQRIMNRLEVVQTNGSIRY